MRMLRTPINIKNMQSRPVRAVRLQPQQSINDLPFPEGAPKPNSPLEVLVDHLNTGEYRSDQLARVDDFAVRTCFESKYKKTRLRDSEAPKFAPGAPMPSALSLKIAQEWIQIRMGPLETWYDGAKGIWEKVVLEAIGSGTSGGHLEVEDADLFTQ